MDDMPTKVNAIEVIKDTLGTLKELQLHSLSKGKEIEGDVSGFILAAARQVEKLIDTLGHDITYGIHTIQSDKLGEFARSMFEQVEHNKELEEFWEEMVQEIPDFIEWVQTLLEKGREIAAEVADVAVEAAEVTAEVAVDAADVLEVVATEV